MKNNILYITYNNYPAVIKKKFSSKFNEKFKNNFIWDSEIIKKNISSSIGQYWIIQNFLKK